MFLVFMVHTSPPGDGLTIIREKAGGVPPDLQGRGATTFRFPSPGLRSASSCIFVEFGQCATRCKASREKANNPLSVRTCKVKLGHQLHLVNLWDQCVMFMGYATEIKHGAFKITTLSTAILLLNRLTTRSQVGDRAMESPLSIWSKVGSSA